MIDNIDSSNWNFRKAFHEFANLIFQWSAFDMLTFQLNPHHNFQAIEIIERRRFKPCLERFSQFMENRGIIAAGFTPAFLRPVRFYFLLHCRLQFRPLARIVCGDDESKVRGQKNQRGGFCCSSHMATQ